MQNDMPTPWGMSQTKEKIVDGALWVTTAKHGGLLIGKKKAKECLSEKAQAIGFLWGHYLAFEEDCAWSAVFYEHPEWHAHMKPELAKKEAEECLRLWYPEYFK